MHHLFTITKHFIFQLDPELEFDREVYPLGLLPNAGVVVGVSQRMSFSACTEFPCFEPTPQAQTILHCLLRHLLQVLTFGSLLLSMDVKFIRPLIYVHVYGACVLKSGSVSWEL